MASRSRARRRAHRSQTFPARQRVSENLRALLVLGAAHASGTYGMAAAWPGWAGTTDPATVMWRGVARRTTGAERGLCFGRVCLLLPRDGKQRAVRAWLWMPASQPPGAGADRVGPHIFQLGWEAFGSADTCQWIEKLGKGFSARLGGVSYIHIKNK
jgi:hypothetical protein